MTYAAGPVRVTLRRYGVIVAVGRHLERGVYPDWGTLSRGVRVDLGWFVDRAYEVGLVLGVGTKGVVARVKVLRLDARLWAGRVR